MKQYCGNCKYWNREDKTSVGCRCECPGLTKYRHHHSSSYKQPSNGTKCTHFLMDSSKNYKPKKGQQMKKYCIAYMGTNKHGTFVDNEIVWMDDAKVTESDIFKIKDSLKWDHNLATIAILNIIPLNNERSN